MTLQRSDLEQFFYVSQDFMCIAGNDGYFKKVNPAFSQALGYTEQELTAVPYTSFLHPEDLKKTIREASQVSSGVPTTFFENRYRCKNGEYLLLSWKCTPVGDQIFAIARDTSSVYIQNQKSIERARREAEEKFRETFEHAGVGMSHAHMDGTITLVNQELCEILGYRREELLQKTIFELLANDDEPTPEDMLSDLVGKKISKLVRERKFTKKDGTPIWILLTTSAVHDESGKLKYFILAHKDITKRKFTEESLKKSEKSIRSLIEAIPQMVWTSDASGKPTYYNRRWYEYTGLSENASMTGEWETVIHPDDRGRVLKQWKNAVAFGESYEIEFRLRHAMNGTYRWQLGRTIPSYDDKSKVISWLGTCTDIDDQKRTQDQLQQSLNQLKRSTAERSRLMANERAAVEASRLKSEFLANMTHEIRTPLNGVIAMTGLLRKTTLDQQQREYTEIINHSAESLLEIVNDILDLSKIEAGKLELEQVDFDLEKVLEGVSRVLETAASNKALELSINISKKCAKFFRGDPSRIRQVVFNLAHNAIKFTEVGGVAIKIDVVSATKGRQIIRFEVTDSGVGIAPAAMDRIWDTFAQADASTTRRFGGTGLGLSICKKLVELMGGKIGATSAPSAGSTFWFEVPLNTGRKVLTSNTVRAPTPKAFLENKSILVVEDHSVNQRVIRWMIEVLGCQHVDVVANGSEALTALSHAPYDLILMDCHMPDMDGYTATKKIRKLSDTKKRNIPVIALTADVLRGTRKRCLESGMNAYVSKPIDIDELQQAIVGCLRLNNAQSTVGIRKPKPSAHSDVVDRSVLLKLSALNADGGSDFVTELITDYLNQAPRLITEIEEAYRVRDLSTLEELSHTLKSSSAALGVKRLAEVAAVIEKCAHDGRHDPIAIEIKRLNLLFKQAQGALRAA